MDVVLQKVRLMDFEQRFQEKVMEVDDKYRLKLQDLMTQNTELKSVHVCRRILLVLLRI